MPSISLWPTHHHQKLTCWSLIIQSTIIFDSENKTHIFSTLKVLKEKSWSTSTIFFTLEFQLLHISILNQNDLFYFIFFFLVSFIHLFYFDRNAIHMRMYPKWLHKALKLWFPIYLDEIKKNVQFSQQTFQRIYLEKTHTFSYVILFI